MPMLKDRVFTNDEVETWQTVLSTHEKTRKDQVVDIFHSGLATLDIQANKIPELWEINDTLEKKSGFSGVYVKGLEDGKSFYPMLAKRLFPVGNFIRDKRDLSYTPEPDMIHDLYGHIPFLVDNKYADFCQKIGEKACRYIDDDEKFHEIKLDSEKPVLVSIPNGTAVALINPTEMIAKVLVLADIAWRPNDNEMDITIFDDYDWQKWSK